MSRHALSDAQWESLEDLLPRSVGAGRPWSNLRQVIDGILWVLATGAPWRDLPERFGPWKTVYERFRRWTQEGVWDRILDRLQAHRHAEGQIDWELFCVDGSVVRAHKAAAGGGKKATSPRTGGSRVGPFPRRVWHQAARGVRLARMADRRPD